MAPTFQIRGICNIQNTTMSCIGKIQILERQGKNVYASWEMHIENGTPLAGISRNYFMNKENASDGEVVSVILFSMINYRIGRKKVFTEVQVINE